MICVDCITDLSGGYVVIYFNFVSLKQCYNENCQKFNIDFKNQIMNVPECRDSCTQNKFYQQIQNSLYYLCQEFCHNYAIKSSQQYICTNHCPNDYGIYQTSIFGQQINLCFQCTLFDGVYCVEQCPGARPFIYNNFCVSSCDFVLNNECVENCSDGYIINISYRQCATCSFYSQTQFQLVYQCADACQLYQEKYCTLSCPQAKQLGSACFQCELFIEIGNIKRCTQNCSQQIYHIDEFNAECGDCYQLSLKYQQMKIYSESGVCVAVCQNFSQFSQCVEQCSNLISFSQGEKICSESCQIGFYQSGQFCIPECYLFIDNGKCGESCESLVYTTQNICVATCQLYIQVQHEQQCTDSCQNASYFFRSENQCVGACQKFVSDLRCVDFCPEFQYSVDFQLSICEQCPYLKVLNETIAKRHFQCISQCSSGYVQEGQTCIPLTNCKVIENNSCVQACQQFYAVIGNQTVCIENCEYFLYANQCVAHCDSFSWEGQCVDSCSALNLFASDSTCVTECINVLGQCTECLQHLHNQCIDCNQTLDEFGVCEQQILHHISQNVLKQLNDNQIAGIVVGSLLIVVQAALIGILITKSRKRKQ
uniref:Uncharacterized protein n=1 Tax=Trepomonas sp. PC1 TaxID=1076344 RepID=A0A146KB48_9EUKA|eukprot:JAP93154.1 hypothetical protein TPC1_14668 [Trepomonas sp. PC1]